MTVQCGDKLIIVAFCVQSSTKTWRTICLLLTKLPAANAVTIAITFTDYMIGAVVTRNAWIERIKGWFMQIHAVGVPTTVVGP